MFFQSLSERIDKTTGDERKKLEVLRQKLLDLTRLIDQRTEAEFKNATSLLDTILAAENIEQVTAEHIDEINDAFVQVLNRALQDANQKNDAVKMPKLQKVVGVLQKIGGPPPELALLEELMDAPDDTTLNSLLEKHVNEITPEFSSVVANVLAHSEEQAGANPEGEDARSIEKLRNLYRTILRFSMQKSMK
jgi:hypothetical protein